ncbi:hypothetical protein J3E68DRAFT_161366 [Trichoderma sp. SZMC 28012]
MPCVNKRRAALAGDTPRPRLFSGEPGRGERRENRENREERRQASLIEHRLSVCLPLLPHSRCPAPWHMAGIVSSVAPNHSTARNNSNHITRTSCTLCSRPSRTSSPLQPPSRELQIAMPLMAQVQASIMYSDTLCMSIAYLAAKYSIPLLSFEARAASHRGSTLYCTLHVYITWLVQIQRLGPL